MGVSVSRHERLAWAALLIAAAALRLVALGDRPPHHDESVHANFGREVLLRGQYRYDPTYHGPLLFYVEAGLFAALGQSDAAARLYPALAGIALVALPLALRRRIGRRTAFFAGVLLAISPGFLYYSRFARNDVQVALFTAAAFVLFLLGRRDWRMLPWVGVAAALHAISKETFYVTLPLVALGALAVALRVGIPRALARSWTWLGEHLVHVVTAVLWFAVVCTLAYTFFFVHPEDWFFPGKAIAYWYNQHKVQRVGGPWSYHLPRLALYEFLIVGAGLVGFVRRIRRFTNLELFCLVWGVSSIAMYAFLGEKTPWLIVHQVLPFVPLAAIQLAHTFSPGGRWWSRSLAGMAIAGTCWSAAAVSFLHPTISTMDPHAELLVFVQTTPDEQAVASFGRAVAAGGADPVAAVSGEATWPLSWQWRDMKVWWSAPTEGMRPPIVVCDPAAELATQERLGAEYRLRHVQLRAWWVEEWHGVKLSEVARWFVTRRAWSPLGATEMSVFVRVPMPAVGKGALE